MIPWTDAEKEQLASHFVVHVEYPRAVQTVLLVELVPHAVISDWGQFNRVFYASGMSRSRLLF